MEFFKTFNAILTEVGQSVTIVIQKRPNGILSTMVHYDDKNADLAQKINLPPIVVRETAEKLDTTFLDTIKEPISEAAGLTASIASFENAKKALAEAHKKEKEAAAAAPATGKAAKKKDTKKQQEGTEPAEQHDNSNLFNGESENPDSTQAESQAVPSESTQQESAEQQAEDMPQDENNAQTVTGQQAEQQTVPEQEAEQKPLEEKDKKELFNEAYANVRKFWKNDWAACIPYIEKCIEYNVKPEYLPKLQDYLTHAKREAGVQ